MQIKKETIAIVIETVNRTGIQWNFESFFFALLCGEEETYKSLTIQKRHDDSQKKKINK